MGGGSIVSDILVGHADEKAEICMALQQYQRHGQHGAYFIVGAPGIVSATIKSLSN